MLVALAVLVVLAAGARNHAPAEAAVLLGVLIVAALAGRWLVRDLRAHPAGFPAPTASHGLRFAAAGPDGARARSRWASQNRTEDDHGARHRSARGRRVLGAALVSIRILREYERAVVFRLGRLLQSRGPGLVMLIPLVDRMVRVDLRTVTITIPPQEVITRDNVPARVAAVCYFRVIDPGAAVTAIEAFAPATSQIAQTTLRSVLGRADLDQLLAERERLNEDLQKIIDEQTEPWGIKVSVVEIKDVEIPEVDAARDGPPGRGRARAPREDHQRRGRVPGRREARGRRRDHRPRAVRAAAALPADPAGDRRRPELDDRLPPPARPAQAVPCPHGTRQRRRRAQRPRGQSAVRPPATSRSAERAVRSGRRGSPRRRG